MYRQTGRYSKTLHFYRKTVGEDSKGLFKKIKETKRTVSGKDDYDNASEREK